MVQTLPLSSRREPTLPPPWLLPPASRALRKDTCAVEPPGLQCFVMAARANSRWAGWSQMGQGGPRQKEQHTCWGGQGGLLSWRNRVRSAGPDPLATLKNEGLTVC